MVKNLPSLFSLFLLFSLLLSACTPGSVAPVRLDDAETPIPIPLEPTGERIPPGKGPTHERPPVKTKVLDPGKSGWAPIVNGTMEFAFDLLKRMDLSQGNLVFSPFSISSAFAMAYAGAERDTASQMKEVLRFPLPRDRFHSSFGDLLADLRLETAGDDFTLKLANGMWGQEGLPFSEDFLAILRDDYAAEMGLVDFAASSESARQEINDWVADQTGDRIQEVLPAGSLSPSTRLVLVNAVYFDALWQYPFDPDKTSRFEFDLLDGSEIEVDMMMTGDQVMLPYVESENWQAVALPYRGGQAEMVIILPDEEYFSTFYSILDIEVYTSILDSLMDTEMLLSMPKFSFVTGFALADDLSAMGMPDAFDPTRADFSGMDGSTDLYIDDAWHLAFIDVDEEGTEAGAATGIVMRSGMLPAFHLVIDRPFLFVIRDVSTGTILFMGYVLDPR